MARNFQETLEPIKCKIQILYALLYSICINGKSTMVQRHKEASPTQDGHTLRVAFIFNFISS